MRYDFFSVAFTINILINGFKENLFLKNNISLKCDFPNYLKIIYLMHFNTVNVLIFAVADIFVNSIT